MRIIILSRSDKHYTSDEGGYCVAGLNFYDKSKWIRLLGKHQYMKITNDEAQYEDGTLCEPLDIVEVDNPILVDRNMCSQCPDLTDSEVQPENYIVPVRRFRKIGRITFGEMLREAPGYNLPFIFSSPQNSLEPYEAKQNHHSLALVKVENLLLYPKARYQRPGYQRHYRSEFLYNGTKYSDISVTDSVYSPVNYGYSFLLFPQAYLFVSLGELFNGKHYKLIATIFKTVCIVRNNTIGIYHIFPDCQYLDRYKGNIQYILWEDAEKAKMRPCKACLQRC